MPRTLASAPSPFLAPALVGALVAYTPIRVAALVKPATSRPLREKLLIGVTSVSTVLALSELSDSPTYTVEMSLFV